MYMYIGLYLHIYEELFHKTRFVNLAFTIETHLFVGMALRAFWKQVLHVYIKKTTFNKISVGVCVSGCELRCILIFRFW